MPKIMHHSSNRKGRKEDSNESKIICKAYLREVQDHQEKRKYQSNLRESKTQTASGLIPGHNLFIKQVAAAVERPDGLFAV